MLECNTVQVRKSALLPTAQRRRPPGGVGTPPVAAVEQHGRLGDRLRQLSSSAAPATGTADAMVELRSPGSTEEAMVELRSPRQH